MANLYTVELKPFIPARDFALSVRFYRDMGFHLEWEDGSLAFFHKRPAAFLLQNIYVKELAENFMMHLLVEDADAWHSQLGETRLVETYGVRMSEIEDRPWGLRDFAINDPAGVLWRIGHNIKR